MVERMERIYNKGIFKSKGVTDFKVAQWLDVTQPGHMTKIYNFFDDLLKVGEYKLDGSGGFEVTLIVESKREHLTVHRTKTFAKEKEAREFVELRRHVTPCR